MQQASDITSVCHIRLKHYTLVDQLIYMLLKHFLRQEVAHILLLALHCNYRKQFDVNRISQKPKKFLAIQFGCLARKN